MALTSMSAKSTHMETTLDTVQEDGIHLKSHHEEDNADSYRFKEPRFGALGVAFHQYFFKDEDT